MRKLFVLHRKHFLIPFCTLFFSDVASATQGSIQHVCGPKRRHAISYGALCSASEAGSALQGNDIPNIDNDLANVEGRCDGHDEENGYLVNNMNLGRRNGGGGGGDDGDDDGNDDGSDDWDDEEDSDAADEEEDGESTGGEGEESAEELVQEEGSEGRSSISSYDSPEENPYNPNDSDDPDDPDDPGPPDGVPEEDAEVAGDDQEVPNFNFIHPQLNVICESLNNCSVREVLALLLAISIRHSLTYDALINLMKVVNAIHGRRYLPIDKHPLWEMLGRNEVGITFSVYCPDCLRGHGRLRDLGNGRNCECTKRITRQSCKLFVQLDLRRQLADLLRKRKIQEALHYRQERQLRLPNSMEDILDGREYRRLSQDDNILASVYNYTYTFNLDGLRLAKSSNSEAWPIYARWNELPFEMRQKHMLLAGVWVDCQQPNMNLFLEGFVNQCNSLSNEGVVWLREEEQEEIRSKFYPTCCVVDAKARCAALNLNGPTGYCACPNCDHRGVYVGGAVHYPFLPPIPIPQRRTAEEIQMCMLQAAEMGGRGNVLGFKGASQLMLLDYFSLGNGVVTDDMHPFAGVIKHHTDLLMHRTRDYRPPYYIGSKAIIAQIDRRMLHIRTPTLISRKPRSLKTRKRWQSSEWRNWLLYYSKPCLEGILEPEYLDHLQLLAQAIFLVTRDIVSEEDCNEAEMLFREYVRLFEVYFQRNNMRYNIHILLHVADCVRDWGPMFCQSTSFFESWNHDVKKTVTSPNAQIDQIITRFLIRRFLQDVDEDEHVSDRVKKEVMRILDNPRLREPVKVGNVSLLGKCTVRAPNAEEQELFNQENIAGQNFRFYKRALIGRVEYRTSDYLYAGESTKSDNSHILTWTDEFAQIVSIVLIGAAEARRVVVGLKILNTVVVNRYVCSVPEGEQIVMIITSFENVRGMCVSCNTPRGRFIMPMANQYEID